MKGEIINTTPIVLGCSNLVQMKVTNDRDAVVRLFPLNVMHEMMNGREEDNKEFKTNLFKKSIPTLAKHFPAQCREIAPESSGFSRPALLEYCLLEENTFVELKAGEVFCLENEMGGHHTSFPNGGFLVSGALNVMDGNPNINQRNIICSYEGTSYIRPTKSVECPGRVNIMFTKDSKFIVFAYPLSVVGNYEKLQEARENLEHKMSITSNKILKGSSIFGIRGQAERQQTYLKTVTKI